MAVTNIHSPRPRIQITQEIIDRAVRNDSGHCMIAEAISAQVVGASSVSVDLQTIRYTDREKGLRYVWLTPALAQQLLLSFDLALPIEPQEIRFGGAQQVVEIRAASRKEANDSATRRQRLEEKEAAGEELSRSEKQSLAMFRVHTAKMGGNHVEDRITSEAKAQLVGVGDAAKRAVKVGGKVPGRAVLSHGRNRRRVYGMRAAGLPDSMPLPPPTST